MAFIKTLEPAVKYMKGKFNKTDATYFKQMYNHTVGVRVDNPYKGAATAAQTAVREKFKACWLQTDAENWPMLQSMRNGGLSSKNSGSTKRSVPMYSRISI